MDGTIIAAEGSGIALTWPKRLMINTMNSTAKMVVMVNPVILTNNTKLIVCTCVLSMWP